MTARQILYISALLARLQWRSTFYFLHGLQRNLGCGFTYQ